MQPEIWNKAKNLITKLLHKIQSFDIARETHGVLIKAKEFHEQPVFIYTNDAATHTEQAL